MALADANKGRSLHVASEGGLARRIPSQALRCPHIVHQLCISIGARGRGRGIRRKTFFALHSSSYPEYASEQTTDTDTTMPPKSTTGTKRKSTASASGSQAAPPLTQMPKFNFLKNTIIIALQDAVMLRKLREEMAKPGGQQNEAFCKDVCDMVDDTWEEHHIGSTVMQLLQMEDMKDKDRKPYTELGFPDGKSADKDCMNDTPKAHLNAEAFAQQAARRDELLYQIASSCVAMAPAADASAKRQKGEPSGEPKPKRTQARDVVFKTSVADDGQRKELTADGVAFDAYADHEKKLQLLLLCRVATLHVANAGLLSSKIDVVEVSIRSMLNRVSGPIVMKPQIVRDAAIRIGNYGGLSEEDEEKLLDAIADTNDWNVLAPRGNNALDRLLGAVFKLPRLVHPVRAVTGAGSA